MTRFRILGYGLLTVLGANVSPSLLVSAHADTIDLVCVSTGRDIPQYNLSLTIDTSAITVTSGYRSFNGNNLSAHPATITNDQVTWKPNSSSSTTYTLDRKTGVLIKHSRYVRDQKWNCR